MTWAVKDNMIQWIFGHIPRGQAIVELGSGDGTTRLLCEDYVLYSVEHDLKWLNKYPSQYIFSPICDGWYHPIFLRDNLPMEYRLLIIDGPIGTNRVGIIDFFYLFRRDIPIAIDDIKRPGEKKIIDFLVGLGYKIGYSDTSDSKRWLVMVPV